jgi:D-psicose/D-tagatose/L-ribulose 3-epimerase
MRTVDRRKFMKSASAIGAVALSVQAAGQTYAKERQGTFKYAFCNESMKGMPWEDQCRLVARTGYQGVEIAPFSLVKEGVWEFSPAERRQLLRSMKENGLQCAGLHWLLAPPPPGLHFTSPDLEVRRKTREYLAQLIDFCSELEGEIMVFGSPKQRDAAGTSVEEATRILADGLHQAAEHAGKRGVMILLEALDRTQTDVVNTLAEALEVVRKVNHPALQTMFDFHNTLDETEPFDVLIRRYYPYIHHVHVQEMDGRYLGAGTGIKDFAAGFQALKDLGFKKWVSVEVFDFEPSPEILAGESMKALKEIEKSLK